MAILIWMASSSAKATELNELTEASTASPIAQAFPLPAYEAHYEVSWYGIPAGESVHKLTQQSENQYHFEVRTEPRMKMLPYHYVESSDFTWNGTTISPQNYFYNNHEGKRRKKGNVLFDWQNNKLKNAALNQPWEADISEGVQDKITQTLSLRQALKSGSTQLNYLVAEEDKIKNYHFTILGEERLKTKLGVLQTIKVEHISRKGARTTLWLAKQFDYLPVKMTQARQGKIVAGGEILSYLPKLARKKDATISNT